MSLKKSPLVCIIILNWNGGKVMEQCIESLKKTSYKNYKAIVIDNGSTDKQAVENLKKLNKNIEIVYLDRNYGYTIGINQGYKHAIKKYDPDYICEMNNDIITIQKEWLSLQIKEMEEHGEYGLSSGKLVFPDGVVQTPCIGCDEGYFEQDRGQFDYIKTVPLVRGGCLVVKRDLVNKIGYPDENFFYGPNDVDYCYRAARAGFKVVYNGFSKSIHLSGHSGVKHEKDWMFLPQTEGMLIFYLRYKGFFKGLLMSARFFVRAFVTRKDPYGHIEFGNLTLHKTSLKRTYLFFRALVKALNKYKKIKQNSPVKILKQSF